VVIGGGLLGLEAAKALKDLGLETHIVEFAPRLMAVQLDDSGRRLLRRRSSARRHGPPAEEHQGDRPGTTGEPLVFADGTPRDRHRRLLRGHPPARRAGARRRARVGERGGIQIDSHCRTTNPDIYAIGECALWEGASSAWSRPATRWRRSRRATSPASDVQFLGADMSTKLKLMGVDVASIGDAHAARRRAELRLHRRGASTRSWCLGGPQAAARRDPGRRRRDYGPLLQWC
jgi:nitrite reductase (NADH) large subunit